MRLTIEEYESWVSKELDSFVKPAGLKGQKLLEEAARTVNDAKRFFDDLARKADRDMPTKKDPVSYRASRFLGHGAREASLTLSGLAVPTQVTWEELKGFRDALSSATRNMKGQRNRTARELSGLYILDMRSFGGATEKVGRIEAKLQDFLDREGSTLQKARTLASIVSLIHSARQELDERLEEAESVLREERDSSKSVQQLEAELNGLASKHPLREVLEVEKELRKESKEFRTVILAHLQRPLRKLRDLSARGEIPISPDQRSAISEYIATPYRSFLSKASGGYLSDILAVLRGALRSGKMGFKPRKTARVLAQLDEVLGDDRLKVKQQKGRELLSRRRRFLSDAECKNLYRVRIQTASELESRKQAREGLLKRRETVNEKVRNSENRLKELQVLAEARTREYLGRQIELERPTHSTST